MEAFRTVLTHAKALVGTPAPLRICLGNVSVDMDSVVGSMALAYYYNLRSKDTAPFVGVANCTKSFFPLKLDINTHLAEHGLSDVLAFWDQFEPARLSDVALIDHNRLDNS
jgi:inorganic pyrophosphatase/exopolyphosphatase